MFFTGTLQEGIAAAIQQTKSLVCFVADDNTESQQWETEFLNDEAISPLIESSAVVLKLVAGSTEEGYLAQLFPVPKKPTVVVMKGGQLREYIAAGVTKEEFVRRLRAVLDAQPVVPAGATSGAASVQESAQSEQGQEQASSSVTAPAEPAEQPAAEQTASPAITEAPISRQPPMTMTTETSTPSSSSPPATSSTTAPTTNTNTTQQDQIQAILAERAARLATQKKQQEEAARAAARARAAAEDPNSPARQAADALRKKQQEAREERQRILKAIEDDKAARKARQLEKQREREVSASAEGNDKGKEKEGEGLPFAPASPMLPRGNQPVQSTGHCALQVRLTDGSTIRSRFSAEKDTVKEVREWVEATVSDLMVKRGRYTFKVLLTPQPSRRIERDEEGKTLGELGLAPSSTLILVPTTSAGGERVSFAGAGAAATEGEGGGNIFSRLIEFLVAFFNTVVAFVSTLFSVSGPPNGGATPEQVATEVRGEQQQQRAERASGRSLSSAAAVHRGTGGSRIKGLGDTRQDEEERKRNDQQFYNGNSTNFEPRHDDEN